MPSSLSIGGRPIASECALDYIRCIEINTTHLSRALINLDSCGAGGREILFQGGPNHPWLMRVS